MSTKKARRTKKRVPPSARKRSYRRAAVLTGIISCMLLSGVIMARWRTLPEKPFSILSMLLSEAAASPTPNPFVPRRAAKEYIYVGGKLQAIEEAKPPVGGTAFDFTGNGSGDAVVFRPSEGNWYVLDLLTNTATLQQLGLPGEVIVPGDYDGDGRTDIAVWRANTGNCSSNNCGWYVKHSSTGTVAYQADWGQAGDVPVPADYDGDGKTDRAVWRPSEGNWYIIQSLKTPTAADYTIHPNWGNSTDRVVPADYDGDGRADLAVFRPSEGNWYIKRSSNGTVQVQGWGQSSDVLAPADYDGDGRADLAVWRPSEGNWYILWSASGAGRKENWGAGRDKLVPADYDGDGRTDIAVWRPSEGNWYIRRSGDGTALVRGWGAANDRPVPASYVRE